MWKAWVCTPLMAIAHAPTPQAAEIVFCDCTSSLDRFNITVYYFNMPQNPARNIHSWHLKGGNDTTCTTNAWRCSSTKCLLWQWCTERPQVLSWLLTAWLEKGALVKTVAKLDLCNHIKTPAYIELRSSWNWIIRRIWHSGGHRKEPRAFKIGALKGGCASNQLGCCCDLGFTQ